MQIHGGLPRHGFAFATQQGIPTFEHVQCLGEHFLKLHVCIILSERLIGWQLGTVGAISVFISIICWVYSPRFVDNGTAYRFSTATSVYKMEIRTGQRLGMEIPDFILVVYFIPEIIPNSICTVYL